MGLINEFPLIEIKIDQYIFLAYIEMSYIEGHRFQNFPC